MKVICPNVATVAEADAEDPAYPAGNVVDEHPAKVWKGTGAVHVLDIATSGAADCVMVVNTNAESITVTTRRGSGAKWAAGAAWAAGASWYSASETLSSILYDLDPAGVGALWGEYTMVGAPHVVSLAITCPAGAVASVGGVIIGPKNEFPQPRMGVQQGLKDYSIVKRLNNGAMYYRKRAVVRTFALTARVLRSSSVCKDFHDLMRAILQQAGPQPLAWRLQSATEDWQWLVFATTALKPPMGDHSHPGYVDVGIDLEEVV